MDVFPSLGLAGNSIACLIYVVNYKRDDRLISCEESRPP